MSDEAAGTKKLARLKLLRGELLGDDLGEPRGEVRGEERGDPLGEERVELLRGVLRFFLSCPSNSNC